MSESKNEIKRFTEEKIFPLFDPRVFDDSETIIETIDKMISWLGRNLDRSNYICNDMVLFSNDDASLFEQAFNDYARSFSRSYIDSVDCGRVESSDAFIGTYGVIGWIYFQLKPTAKTLDIHYQLLTIINSPVIGKATYEDCNNYRIAWLTDIKRSINNHRKNALQDNS